MLTQPRTNDFDNFINPNPSPRPLVSPRNQQTVHNYRSNASPIRHQFPLQERQPYLKSYIVLQTELVILVNLW